MDGWIDRWMDRRMQFMQFMARDIRLLDYIVQYDSTAQTDLYSIICSSLLLPPPYSFFCVFAPNRRKTEFTPTAIRPRIPLTSHFSASSAPTNRRTSKLNTLPNARAITVLVRMMTLYGMLKSGVGRGRSREVVRILTFPDVMTAGAMSNPRLASGGYSVYRRIAFSKSYVRITVLLAGIDRRTSSCVPLFRSNAGR